MIRTNDQLLIKLFHFEWTKLNKNFRIGFFISLFFLLGFFIFLFVFYNTQVDSTDMAGSYFTQSADGFDLDPPYISGKSDGDFDEIDEANLSTYSQILQGDNFPSNLLDSFSPINERRSGILPASFDQNIVHLEHMIENEIEPRYPIIMQIPEWEFYYNSLLFPEENYEELNYQWGLQLHYWTPHRSHYDKGLHTIWYSLREQFYFVPLFIIVFFFSAYSASDRSFIRNHLSFLKLHAVRPLSYYAVKWLNNLFWICLLYGLLIAGILVTSLFYNGIGDYTYPLFGYVFTSQYLAPELVMQLLGDYLIESLTLLILGTICVVTLMQWIGQFVRSELLNGLLGIGIVSLTFVLPAHDFNPFVFFKIHEVVSGSILFERSFEYLQFTYGIYWFLGLTSLFFIGGLLSVHLNWNYRKAYLVA